jgi:hypothetical protein
LITALYSTEWENYCRLWGCGSMRDKIVTCSTCLEGLNGAKIIMMDGLRVEKRTLELSFTQQGGLILVLGLYVLLYFLLMCVRVWLRNNFFESCTRVVWADASVRMCALSEEEKRTLYLNLVFITRPSIKTRLVTGKLFHLTREIQTRTEGLQDCFVKHVYFNVPKLTQWNLSSYRKEAHIPFNLITYYR